MDEDVKPKPRIRLEFLDGLRGLAALYVALGHTVGEDVSTLPPHMRWLFGWTDYARLAVDVFIVLSGYCLMLPVARSVDQKLRGGALSYLKRRAWRILPPYYAAFVLSLLFILASRTGVQFIKGHPNQDLAFTFSTGNLVSHLFLVHNWSVVYNEAINGPLWSVATEWQIYFLFPLLLLPVWRKFGIVAAVATGFGVGMLPHLLLPSRHNFDWACPWFVGLFALGMFGAVIGFSDSIRLTSVRRVVRWEMLSVFFAACAVAFVRYWPTLYYRQYGFIGDTLAGLAAISLIIFCANHARRFADSRVPVILRFLESRPAMFLGSFSYSLYLTHRIAMLKVFPILQVAHLKPLLEHCILATFGMAWILLFAYLFHLAFERPFMSGFQKRAEQKEGLPGAGHPLADLTPKSSLVGEEAR
jgi:peptidoglycan/LPS O-acetylase OafA/YrhL